jgi:opacity protein-like surface antigen
MKKLYLFLGFCLCFSVPAQAQHDYPRVEVFGGYSYLRTSPIFQDSIPKGWDASLTGNLRRNLGIEADFSGHTGGTSAGSGLSHGTHLFLVGPRYVARLGNFVPWAHALFGAAHTGVKGRNFLGPTSESTTWFAWATGGGLDARLHKNISLRLFQVDYVRVNGSASFSSEGHVGTYPSFTPGASNNLRISVGVVIGWGKG